jgi:hypothetical protein
LATVLALLTRMRGLNTELMRQVAFARPKRPPSESMHRPQSCRGGTRSRPRRSAAQAQDVQRRALEQGVPLSANTLAAASGKAIDLLDPIIGHIPHKTLSSKYFGFDATGIQVLDPALRVSN